MGAIAQGVPQSGGSLTIVGTGISAVGQTTIEARAHMQKADKLLYLVADPATSYWVQSLNPSSESLQGYYGEGKRRLDTYLEMVERILHFVRQDLRVCVAFYGHPGVFVYPSHQAIDRARAEGYPAKMLPGISADACLFADIGVDPGTAGCQSYEATDFLLFRRKIDPNVSLVLWQISVIGELGYRTDRYYNPDGVKILVDELTRVYGAGHEVIIYVASQYAVCDPEIKVVTLENLPETSLSPVATLFVPPLGTIEPDAAMAARLGIDLSNTLLPTQEMA